MRAGSSPVSRGSRRSASTTEPRQGWEVKPERLSIARSTASAPASTAASTLAAAIPDVSWVWKWTGSPVSSRSAATSSRADAGFSSPPMSLIPRTWVPASRSSRAIAR